MNDRDRPRVAHSFDARSWENRRRPAGNRTPNPAGLSNGASRMIFTPPSDGLSEARRDGITSISVTFHGVTYRSALEADWAKTFTDLGIYFEYEPQPWRLPSGPVYDCDFYLPTMRTYCEAKGPHNDRLWKTQEFAAVLAANEFPRAFQVLVLRPAGPENLATWESADPNHPCPHLTLCEGCQNWAFTDTDDDGELYCRRCYSLCVLDGLTWSGSAGASLAAHNGIDMRKATRWAATA